LSAISILAAKRIAVLAFVAEYLVDEAALTSKNQKYLEKVTSPSLRRILLEYYLRSDSMQ